MRITIETIHGEPKAVAYIEYPNGERCITIHTPDPKRTADGVYKLLKEVLEDGNN